MTWLTQLVLDTRDTTIRRFIGDADYQHRYLMHLVADNLGDTPRREGGLLYRIESASHSHRTKVLVQTREAPLLDRLPPQGLVSTATRAMAPLLEALETGSLVRYRIVANPTKRWSKNAPEKEQVGKLHVLRGPHAEQWWRDRATANGLHLRTADWRPLPDAPVKGKARHAMAKFDGVATVIEPDALREALRSGIGRSRSYGCGLLSIAPLTGHGRPPA